MKNKVEKLIILGLLSLGLFLLSHSSHALGLCSSSFITSDGYIITAAHCYSSKKIEGVYLDHTTGKAAVKSLRVIVRNIKRDLMILKMDGISNQAFFEIGRNLVLGDTVTLNGWPKPDIYGYDLKSYVGIVIDLNSLVSTESYTDQLRLEIEGKIGPGMSGGPVLNAKKQIVGVLSASPQTKDIDALAPIALAVNLKDIYLTIYDSRLVLVADSHNTDLEEATVMLILY